MVVSVNETLDRLIRNALTTSTRPCRCANACMFLDKFRVTRPILSTDFQGSLPAALAASASRLR
jgi:hypothetical protein